MIPLPSWGRTLDWRTKKKKHFAVVLHRSSTMASCVQLMFPVVVVLIAMFLGIGHESQYVFDPVKLKGISEKAIAAHAGNVTALKDHVVLQLREAYPQYITKEPEWMFNNAGPLHSLLPFCPSPQGSVLINHPSI